MEAKYTEQAELIRKWAQDPRAVAAVKLKDPKVYHWIELSHEADELGFNEWLDVNGLEDHLAKIKQEHMRSYAKDLLSHPEMHTGTNEQYIYLLTLHDAIVYIARTDNVFLRVEEHRKAGMMFDEYKWRQIPYSASEQVVNALLRKFRPKLNAAQPETQTEEEAEADELLIRAFHSGIIGIKK